MQKDKKMRKVQIFSIVLFIAMLGIPIICMNRQPDQISEIDNRKLTELPANLLTTEEREQLESYLNDRIGFRTQMIRVYTVENDKLFHVMIHPTYTYGKENYVFFNMDDEVVDVPYLDIFIQFLEKMQKDCENQGITYNFWLDPSKKTIYTEYLPNGYHWTGGALEYLEDNMQKQQISYLETIPALKEAKKSKQVFNKQYDAGHWNDAGAFAGMGYILEQLQTEGVDVDTLDINDYQISEVEQKTLPVSYFPIQDMVPVYVPVMQQAVEDHSYDEAMQEKDMLEGSERYVNPKKPDAPKAVIFHGSYLEGDRMKFLYDQFSEATFVNAYSQVTNYQKYIDMFQPDVVLFETAEYVIFNDYYDVSDLTNVIEGGNTTDER